MPGDGKNYTKRNDASARQFSDCWIELCIEFSALESGAMIDYPKSGNLLNSQRKTSQRRDTGLQANNTGMVPVIHSSVCVFGL